VESIADGIARPWIVSPEGEIAGRHDVHVPVQNQRPPASGAAPAPDDVQPVAERYAVVRERRMVRELLSRGGDDRGLEPRGLVFRRDRALGALLAAGQAREMDETLQRPEEPRARRFDGGIDVHGQPKKRRGLSTVIVRSSRSVTPICFRYGMVLCVLNSMPSGFTFSSVSMVPVGAIDTPKYQSFDRKICRTNPASMSRLIFWARCCHDSVFDAGSVAAPHQI